MGSLPVYVFNHHPGTGKKNELISWAENPVLAKVMTERRNHFRQPGVPDNSFLETIARESRVIIVEGISGAGKDTFQMYLKEMIEGRDVYDYSEGEVLHSWKQFQIEGILQIQVKFMMGFVKYVKDIVNRDDNAVFLLNRFHLSTYAWTIIQRQNLGKEYDEIINILRALPVHVFILHVDENEIEKRSVHPERSSAWQKFQQKMLENHTFCERLEKQQALILEAAANQRLPYSVIKVAYEPKMGDAKLHISEAPSIARRDLRTNAANTKFSRRKTASSSDLVNRPNK